MEKDIPKIIIINGNQKRAGMAIWISDKINLKSNTIKRDTEGHYILTRSQYFKKIK